MKKLVTILLIVSLSILPLSGCSLLFGKKTFEFKPTKVTFQALGVSKGEDGKAIGAAHDIVVDIKKKNDQKIKIGFYEDEVAGTGDMWKAAGWSAALATTLLLNVNLADYEISYTLTGKTDGPSAGAALTVATMASLLGHKIKKNAAMTGAINVDGSIGPVGGIPQKVEGAKEAGKKLVLIPTGQRFDADENTGEMVDVIDKGRDLGLEVKEVSDIYEAYELLVGKPLPRPKVDSEEPELPNTSMDQLKAKANEWNARYTETVGKYKQLSQLMRKQFSYIATSTDALMDSSDKHYNNGLFATSYGEATQAVAKLEMAYAAAKTFDAALTAILSQKDSLTAAKAVVKSYHTASFRLDSLYERLKEEKADSLGDTLAIANAYGAVWEATGLENIAKDYLARGGKDYTTKLQNIGMAAFYAASMPNYLEYSEDFLEIGMDTKGAPAPSVEKVQALSEILRRAAEANLNVFDTTVLAERAKAKGMNEDVYRWLFMNYEIAYSQARSLIDIIGSNIKRTAKTKRSAAYATLGAAMSSYIYSSYLNAKYYALQAEVDDNGNVTSVRREKALTDMLDYNLDQTKENIAIAKKAGGISAFPIINYEVSRMSREGSVDQKVQSLQSSWRASLEAQIMTMLSGRLELAPNEANEGKTLVYSWIKTKK